VTPEGTDREALRERLASRLQPWDTRLMDDGHPSIYAKEPGALADAILDAGGVGVYDPTTHVAVDRDLLRRMARWSVNNCDVTEDNDPFTESEWELIERWSA